MMKCRRVSIASRRTAAPTMGGEKNDVKLGHGMSATTALADARKKKGFPRNGNPFLFRHKGLSDNRATPDYFFIVSSSSSTLTFCVGPSAVVCSAAGFAATLIVEPSAIVPSLTAGRGPVAVVPSRDCGPVAACTFAGAAGRAALVGAVSSLNSSNNFWRDRWRL